MILRPLVYSVDLHVSLSVVLVLVCSLPNVTLSAPNRRAFKVSRRHVGDRHLRFTTGNFNIIILDHLLKNNEFAGNTKYFDDEMSMKADIIVQTFVYVPVDSKYYASDSFAFVNDQAEQFRRFWRQFQADKKDVYLLPESSIRKWRTLYFLVAGSPTR